MNQLPDSTVASPVPPVPAAARARGTGRLVVLDGLRIVAALMVAMFHYTGFDQIVEKVWGIPADQAFGQMHRLTSYFWMGVELFFMISGFVICMSSWGRSPGDFFRSRITRLFPAYWAAIVITTVVLLLWPGVGHPLELHDILINLTMVQSAQAAPSVDGIYWTLYIEARFYLLFFFVMLLPGRALTLRRAMLFAYAWLVVSLLMARSDSQVARFVLMPEYAPLFVAGIGFFLIYKFGGDIYLWGLVGFAFLLSEYNQHERVLQYGPANLHRDLNPYVGMAFIAVYFVILGVIAMGWTSRIQWRWLTTAGLLTYPFYLLHEEIGWTVIHAVHGWAPRWVILPAVTALMLLCAYALHRVIEKPVSRWMKRKLVEASPAAREARDHLASMALETPAVPTPAVPTPAGPAVAQRRPGAEAAVADSEAETVRYTDWPYIGTRPS